jgi:hypothetical protein
MSWREISFANGLQGSILRAGAKIDALSKIFKRLGEISRRGRYAERVN